MRHPTAPRLLSILLALAVAAPLLAQGLPEPCRHYAFSHEPEADDDRDNFPDEWERILDRSDFFPVNYFKLRPEREAHPAPDLAPDEPWPIEDGLWMFLVRGNMGIRTKQPVPADPLNRYRLRGRIRTEGLTRGFACVSLHVADGAGNVAVRVDSERVTGDSAWRSFEIETAAVPRDGGEIVLECLLMGDGDIGASAWFADLQLYEEPIFRILGDEPGGEAAPLAFFGSRPQLRFRIDGLPRGGYRRQLAFAASGADWLADESAELPWTATDDKGFVEESVRTPFQEPGLYHGRYRLFEEGTLVSSETFSFAILGDHVPPTGRGRIGGELSIVEGAPSRSIAPLAELSAGWTFVSIPVGGPAPRASDLAATIALLPRAGIRPVAYLGPFHQAGPSGYGCEVRVDTGSFYRRGPAAWGEPVRQALLANAQRIEEWLLAPPDDDSLDQPDFLARVLPELVRAVRDQAPWIQIGLPVRPETTIGDPETLPPEIDFLHVVFDERATPAAVQETIRRLSALGKPVDATLRVARSGEDDLDPSLDDIAPLWIELHRSPVRRIHLAPSTTGIRSWGYWSKHGPTRLFLAARAINRFLGAAEYAGRLPIVEDFAAPVFRLEGGRTLTALWRLEGSDPVYAYVGPSPAIVRLDGSLAEDSTEVNQTELHPRREPIFLTELDDGLMETLLSLTLDQPVLSPRGIEEVRRVEFVNRYATPRDFRVRIGTDPAVPPVEGGSPRKAPRATWQIDRERRQTRLAPEESFQFPVSIALPNDVLLKRTPLVVDGLVLGTENLPFQAVLYVSIVSPIRIEASYSHPDLVLTLVNTDRTTYSIRAYANVPGLYPMRESDLLTLRTGAKEKVSFYLPERPGFEKASLHVGIRQYTAPLSYDLEFSFRRPSDGRWELVPVVR